MQAYEGVVIGRRNRGLNSSFVVRKVSSGEGVERTFQLYSPTIASIEVKRRGDVRRAKLYYLRDRSGKSARIREKLTHKSAAEKAAAGRGGGIIADAARRAAAAALCISVRCQSARGTIDESNGRHAATSAVRSGNRAARSGISPTCVSRGTRSSQRSVCGPPRCAGDSRRRSHGSPNCAPTRACSCRIWSRVPAAVLIPLIVRGNDVHVLLTERTAHLNDHAGQISFPGGRVEEGDADPRATALREDAGGNRPARRMRSTSSATCRSTRR